MQYQIFNLKTTRYSTDPQNFEYRLEFKLVQGGGMVYFHDVRRWLTDSYGWSDQLGNAVTNQDNPYWTWHVNYDSYKIYLQGTKELMLFKLKFPNNDMI